MIRLLFAPQSSMSFGRTGSFLGFLNLPSYFIPQLSRIALFPSNDRAGGSLHAAKTGALPKRCSDRNGL